MPEQGELLGSLALALGRVEREPQLVVEQGDLPQARRGVTLGHGALARGGGAVVINVPINLKWASRRAARTGRMILVQAHGATDSPKGMVMASYVCPPTVKVK